MPGSGWPWRSHRERVARWFAALAWHWVAIVVVSLLGLSLFASIGREVFEQETGGLDDAVRTGC